MERDLTIGSIHRNLFHFAWPLMLGMLFQTAFNIVDTVFVGMLGPNELAAISLTLPVVLIFIAIAGGLAIGATALVAQAVGARRMKEADNIAEHSLLFSVFIGVIIAALGILFSPLLFSFMGASAEIIPLTTSYSNIIFVGFIFLFLGFMAMSIIRAQGNTKTPMKFQVSAVALNIVLDPIMIFGLFGFPALGLVGAALATIISRIVMSALALLYLLTDRTKIKLRPRDFSLDFSILGKIVAVGFPASIGQSIHSIGLILLMALVGSFGSLAIAAYGIGLRLDTLIIFPSIGLSNAVIAMVGQNYGKKEHKRAVRTVEYGTLFTVLISLLFVAPMLAFPGLFFVPFTREQGIISIGAGFLSIAALSFVFRAAWLSLNAGFQGTGKTYISMIIIAVHWALTLVFAWWLMQSQGLKGIWLAILYSSIITALLSFAVFKSGKWL